MNTSNHLNTNALCRLDRKLFERSLEDKFGIGDLLERFWSLGKSGSKSSRVVLT